MPEHRQSLSKNEAEGAETECAQAEAVKQGSEELEPAHESMIEKMARRRAAGMHPVDVVAGILDDSPMLELYGNDVDAYIADIRGRSSWPGFDVIGPALSGEKRETRAMVLTDSNYEALEAAAVSEGRTMQDLLNEAVELWRAEVVLSEAEREELKQAIAEADEKGTVEFEAFFAELLGDES